MPRRVRVPVHRVQQPALGRVARRVDHARAGDRFAIHFDMSSEINEPEKPTTAEKINKDRRSRLVPLCARIDSSPSSRKTTVTTTSTATLVAKNNAMRFISFAELRVQQFVARCARGRRIQATPREPTPAPAKWRLAAGARRQSARLNC